MWLFLRHSTMLVLLVFGIWVLSATSYYCVQSGKAQCTQGLLHAAAGGWCEELSHLPWCSPCALWESRLSQQGFRAESSRAWADAQCEMAQKH